MARWFGSAFKAQVMEANSQLPAALAQFCYASEQPQVQSCLMAHLVHCVYGRIVEGDYSDACTGSHDIRSASGLSSTSTDCQGVESHDIAHQGRLASCLVRQVLWARNALFRQPARHAM